MRIYDPKCFLSTFVFACSLIEIGNAKEYIQFLNDELRWRVNNDELEKFTEWTLNNSDSRLPFISNIFKSISSGNISNPCKESLFLYFNGFLSLKPWALEMFDASGKPPSTLLLGTNLDYGSSEDCLGIKVFSDDESILFKGQFAMIHLQHPLFQPSSYKTDNGTKYVDAFGAPPNWVRDLVDGDISSRFGLYLGICSPSTCTEEDLYNILSTYTGSKGSRLSISDLAVEKDSKYDKWSFPAKFAMIFLSSILVLNVIGTSLDFIDRGQLRKRNNPEESINRELLKSFSIFRNVQTVVAPDTKKSPVDCTIGMRILFCIWVMMGHFFVYPFYWKELRYRNLNSVHEFMNPKLLMVSLNNVVIVVEGFVYLSGFLLIYSSWKKMERVDGNIDIWENIFMKYWRLTPGHLFIIMVTFILPYVSTGPGWETSWTHENGNCLRNGWRNLLYFHNFNDAIDVCLLHTWYIAITIQFVIISLPLMILIYKYPKLGLFICFVTLFGSIAHTYHASIKNEFLFCSYNHVRIPQRAIDFVSKIYLHSNFHLPSNVVGMLSGLVVVKFKNRKLSKAWLTTGWIFCGLCFIESLYAVYLSTTDLRITALYNSTRNTIFCLGWSWIVYTCANGYGGVIDKVLSWKALVPISRISYSIYLAHPLFLMLRDSSQTDRYYMDKISQVPEVVSYLLISFILGFIVCVIVEEPCNKMYDTIKKRLSILNQKNHRD